PTRRGKSYTEIMTGEGAGPTNPGPTSTQWRALAPLPSPLRKQGASVPPHSASRKPSGFLLTQE
ncbi:MAG: hypothetical protein R6V12_10600, partial [Candidatus Hydrogenedentota bacterium]